MHAYQALVWNKVVTRRIEAFGEKVLIGDFVLLPEGMIGNFTSEEAMSGSSTGTLNHNMNKFVLEKSITSLPPYGGGKI
jgi:tRNA(Glu) U13 pseudouridine synthase TruD